MFLWIYDIFINKYKYSIIFFNTSNIIPFTEDKVKENIINPTIILNGIPTIKTFICGITLDINANNTLPKNNTIIIGITNCIDATVTYPYNFITNDIKLSVYKLIVFIGNNLNEFTMAFIRR